MQSAEVVAGSQLSCAVGRGLAISEVRAEVCRRSARVFGQKAVLEHVSVNVPTRSFSVSDYEATERGSWRRTTYEFEFTGQVATSGRQAIRFTGTGIVDDTEPYSAVFVRTLDQSRDWQPPRPPWALSEAAKTFC
eukprot:TRINITY_DN5210_c0_g1_i5.p2 TRINITY_DN5210_c0_g1~~TRINITY_DN5210_c0_g1_i5.p2  ORF type:complete len:135 (+),score=8.35 TRINITY_DN5210_c0_g1_i5:317-721(+)